MRRRSEVPVDRIPPKAREAAQALKDEVQPDNPKPTSRIEFGSANRDPSDQELHPEFDQIVESLVIEHPYEEYLRLEKLLKIGRSGSAMHGAINEALDEAESNARRAHKLWMDAKVEKHRWELANSVVWSAAKIEATRILQAEKDNGKRSKQITDADVEAMILSKFPDEWVAQQNKKRRVEAMESSMSNLSEMWASRCRSLQTMLSKVR